MDHAPNEITGGHVNFVPGHRLSRALYDIVAPIIAETAPNLPYTAALIGSGSDVLGLDTPRSMDHDWGPRLTILLDDDDIARWRQPVLAALESGLPEAVLGIPTFIPGSHDLPGDEPVSHHGSESLRQHGVAVTTLQNVTTMITGINLSAGITPGDWLTIPQQCLLEMTAGPVYRDDSGLFTQLRNRISWYPDDIWRYLLAARWKRIAQLEAFVGRTGELDDDLGSQLITLRIIDDTMHLAFLQERRYAPYAKWLGTAFSRLDIAARLMPLLNDARFARAWQERETHLLPAIELLAHRQNALALADDVPVVRQTFFDRPFQVLFAERYARALLDAITDPAVRRLPRHIGSIDTLTDNTDARGSRDLHSILRVWFDTHGEDPS
jgi:hypothetical protein